MASVAHLAVAVAVAVERERQKSEITAAVPAM